MKRVLTFRIQQRDNYFFTAFDVRVYEIDEGRDLAQYEPVPILSKEMAPGSLRDALSKGTTLRGFQVSERSANLPLLVVVADETATDFCGPFDQVLTSGPSLGLRADLSKLGRVEAISDGVDFIDDEDLWFVERSQYQNLLAELEKAAASGRTFFSLTESAPVESPSAVVAGESSITKDVPVVVTPESTSVTQGPTVSAGPQLTEEQFLQRLHTEAQRQGLYFCDEDFISFHTALKTGSLAILSGLSGTGKSRLVEVYRRSLGLEDHTHFLWLSVRPSWNDDADLIGYYDPLNRLYRPGETGLVDLLLNAEQRPDELFMVCLDEMNLARVEHYFSQFLSNMERPADQRKLRLYAPELRPEVYNAHRYPPTVRIGSNVLFCGTINIDESTHSFSDKVLDRSNLIRIEHVDLRSWWQELCHGNAPAAARYGDMSPVSASNWHSWCIDFDPSPYGPQVELFQQINEILGTQEDGARFGYRVVHQILLYLQRIPRRDSGEPMISAAEALDQQICQRILSKVRGSGAELRDLFRPRGPLETCLKESSLSDFTRSLAEIARKYRELDRHGFTS